VVIALLHAVIIHLALDVAEGVQAYQLGVQALLLRLQLAKMFDTKVETVAREVPRELAVFIVAVTIVEAGCVSPLITRRICMPMIPVPSEI